MFGVALERMTSGSVPHCLFLEEYLYIEECRNPGLLGGFLPSPVVCNVTAHMGSAHLHKLF
jgi:hypothetical protein